ncbi:hypothetical protein Q3W71_04330 [Micromonospora sp. C28SCA-DRY-2]|uniref:hypothetical protein n=1 Tax=Micromonospora sp. C28SCA-DRY-2 TaxID=3059522 RepID=UPI00267683BB|nr:hypothetical protein [Micromonospora sp. C28SCA-DRY-2]MDO3700905.1 hypothetical protein [Micromonospora sp. C28SCA-DRY-2]
MTRTLPPPAPHAPHAPPAPPAVARRPTLPCAVFGWALAYGALRLWWAVAGAPAFPPLGTDLMVFTGWWAVVLCAATALLGVALNRARAWRPALVAAGWAVCAALLLSCALLLLDLVGLLILDPGAAFHPGAFASRLGCLAGVALLAAALVDHRRRRRGDCRRCGRTGRPRATGPAVVPGWARVAAWAAVAGCLLRLAAQVWVGFDEVPLSQGASMVAFEVGFLLAGVLLPLALVYGWGQVWPRWVPLLAGRRVPRLLPLVPAAVFAVGLVGYFGIGLAQLTVETVTGTFDPGDGRYPLAFFWVAEPAYWVWGWGLGVAAVDYHRRARRACPACGR